MAVKVVCPGCGADQEFATGASLRVCDFCKSVIARRDRDLENLGKLVDLVQTESPLELQLVGALGGKNFRLVGRAQIAHPKGGVWDEWYAEFADGRWGWLAEAQGRFTMMFASTLGGRVPVWDSVEPGARMLELPGGPWTVVERSTGERRGAAGELPWDETGGGGGPFRKLAAKGESFEFVDLSAPDGVVATIDYGTRGAGEPPRLYVGREVTLAELGWGMRAPVARDAAPTVKADRLACPSCDGALELRVPDKTLRIACPFCGQLCDVSEGKLTMFQALQPRGIHPRLPLGQKGTLDGTEWTVIGFMRRATKVSSVWYDWDEYLLYEPRKGFRWLVCAQGHWTYVTPIPLADVQRDHAVMRYQGRMYKAFQSGEARVEYVAGEFYWKVAPGETARTADNIAPPYMLSLEGDESEMVASHGVYVPRRQIAKAFGVEASSLPDLPGVAPNQPYPHMGVFKTWGWLLLVATVLAIVIFNSRGKHTVYEGSVKLEPGGTAVWFSEPFELRAHRNVEVQLYVDDLQDAWVYADADLFDEDTGVVQGFDAEISYYSGVEGGESWSEGSHTTRRYVSAPPAGLYSLRLELQQSSVSRPRYVQVTVSQGVARWTHLLLMLLGISLLPLALLIHYGKFEKERWEESSLSWGDSE